MLTAREGGKEGGYYAEREQGETRRRRSDNLARGELARCAGREGGRRHRAIQPRQIGRDAAAKRRTPVADW